MAVTKLQQILTYIREHPGSSYLDIAKAFSIPTQTASANLSTLFKRGRIVGDRPPDTAIRYTAVGEKETA